MDAYVALEGGHVVEARGRAPGTANGELVFTTAYTGYEESLTDPSYEEQILTFAYPLIGNYGVRPERFESDRVHPRAAVTREMTDDVAEWLAEEDVPAVDHIDTRDLVTDIREEGAMACGIAVGDDVTPEDALAELEGCVPMSDHTDIGAQVSVAEPVVHNAESDGATVALVDCGAKQSIVDSLVERGATVHVLPYDATADDVAEIDPELLFISNGPGDPENFDAAVDLVDPYVLASQQSAGDDFQGWTAAQLTLLGTNSPENFDQIGSFNITTESGTQYEGVLFSQENPASGQFEANNTYNPNQIGGTQYVVTSDRIVELESNFTVDDITTTDGQTVQNVTIQKTTYETSNVTGLKQQYEDLAYKRAQIEAREKALKQSAGGGLLGGGSVPPVVALAVIGTLLTIVVLQN